MSLWIKTKSKLTKEERHRRIHKLSNQNLVKPTNIKSLLEAFDLPGRMISQLKSAMIPPNWNL